MRCELMNVEHAQQEFEWEKDEIKDDGEKKQDVRLCSLFGVN